MQTIETLREMPAQPEWLRSDVRGRPVGVDREAGVIRGVILAEEGVFKDRRGEFDRKSIRKIVALAQAKTGGLKARFSHPTMSSDGLGKFLGRHKNVHSDTVLREMGKDAAGKAMFKEVLVARGDLHLDKTALEEPPQGGKPLGVYVMDLADSDPDALGESLVLQVDEIPQLDNKGKPLMDAEGRELPPIWMPNALHACDVVDDGDATHSFLSADILAGLPDAIVRQGCQLLDAQFAGQERDVVEARLSAFVARYLAYRFGNDEAEGFGAEPTETELTVAESEPAKPDPESDPLTTEIYLALQD